MTKTDKYKFNLIDTSDPFSPEPLNTNTKEMEKVLTALESADAANKAELQAAVQSAQSAASSALSAHAADITQHAFVKLGTVQIPANGSGSVPVGDPTKYSMLVVNVNVGPSSTSALNAYINGRKFAGLATGKESQITMLVYPMDTYTAFRGTYHQRSNSPNTWNATWTNLAWSGNFTMSFSGCDVASTATVYGLRA